jgi:hypothetical protein
VTSQSRACFPVCQKPRMGIYIPPLRESAEDFIIHRSIVELASSFITTSMWSLPSSMATKHPQSGVPRCLRWPSATLYILRYHDTLCNASRHASAAPREHTLALVQENAALPSFRASTKTPTFESIHATFAFSGSVAYYIMASPGNLGADRKADRCRIPSIDDKYPHWFQAITGLKAMLANHRDQLASGPFNLLLSRDHVSGCTSHILDVALFATLDAMYRLGMPSRLKIPTLITQSNSSSSSADPLS